MTIEPPTIGQEDWGDDLNAYLIDLEERIAANVARITLGEEQSAANTARIAELEGRVTALEAKPEYVWGTATYMFSSAAPPATGSQIRLNNGDPQMATMMDVRRLDSDNADRSLVLGMVTTNTLIRLQDYDDAAHWYRYRVTGPATKVGVDNYNVPVVWHSGAGTVPNAKINVGMLIDVPTQ